MIGIKDQYFGTEIEMTGITRQCAAEVVAEMFGTEAYYDGTTYGVWSVIYYGKKIGMIATPIVPVLLCCNRNYRVTGKEKSLWSETQR